MGDFQAFAPHPAQFFSSPPFRIPCQSRCPFTSPLFSLLLSLPLLAASSIPPSLSLRPSLCLYSSPPGSSLQGLVPGRPGGSPRTLPLNLGSRSAGAWELPVPNLPSAASPRARSGRGWGSQVPAWSLRPGRPPPTHLGAAWAQRPGGVSAAGGIKMTDAGEEGKVFLCLKRPGLVERKS